MEQVASDFWAVLWRCLCLLLVFILAIVAAASTEQAMVPEETPVKALLLEAIPFIGLALGTVLLIRFVPPMGIDAGLSTSNAGWHLGAGLVIGLVWVSVTLAIVSVPADLRLMPQNLNFSTAMAMAALALLMNVAMQQLLTRGYIFGVIDWTYGSAAAVTVSLAGSRR
ncbi:hypothetical protein [Blastomonas aquatica]|uniref:Uncharacterized protein n=1 Tax=Blastomonas aquatica TaxID=1510276 RepID=A0ABQ1JQA4_9SPHN|nr:hypothetical protein [Blastomonas aquatica]GGB71975.1 hypothetical protein GCM10010833_28970 [Blastomonas aquatica]